MDKSPISRLETIPPFLRIHRHRSVLNDSKQTDDRLERIPILELKYRGKVSLVSTAKVDELSSIYNVPRSWLSTPVSGVYGSSSSSFFFFWRKGCSRLARRKHIHKTVGAKPLYITARTPSCAVRSDEQPGELANRRVAGTSNLLALSREKRPLPITNYAQ